MYSTLLIYFFLSSVPQIYIIPGWPGIPGMRTAILYSRDKKTRPEKETLVGVRFRIKFSVQIYCNHVMILKNSAVGMLTSL